MHTLSEIRELAKTYPVMKHGGRQFNIGFKKMVVQWYRCNRRKLQLSAEEMAGAIGVTDQTIYNWLKADFSECGRDDLSMMPRVIKLRGFGNDTVEVEKTPGHDAFVALKAKRKELQDQIAALQEQCKKVNDAIDLIQELGI